MDCLVATLGPEPGSQLLEVGIADRYLVHEVSVMSTEYILGRCYCQCNLSRPVMQWSMLVVQLTWFLLHHPQHSSTISALRSIAVMSCVFVCFLVCMSTVQVTQVQMWITGSSREIETTLFDLASEFLSNISRRA